MTNISKYFEQVVYGILFMIAIASSIYLINSYVNLFEQQRISDNHGVFYKSVYEVDESNISTAELILSLYHGLDFDIQIDDTLISKVENLDRYIHQYSITNKIYRRTYLYNGSGSITRVIYTPIPTI